MIEIPAKKDFLSVPVEKSKKIHRSRSLANGDSIFWRLCAWGKPGTGKTRLIVEMLRAGLKVYVCDMDWGGTGLSTVRRFLRKSGEEALLLNLERYDFNNFDEFDEFIDSPNNWVTEVDGIPLFDWNPDVLVLEGGSNLQGNMIDEKALSYNAMTNKASDQRVDGVQAERQDYNVIRRISARSFDKFLRIHNPSGKLINKFITCHEKEPRKDNDGIVMIGEIPEPDIVGGIRKNWHGAFDACIRTTVKTKGGKEEYFYECASSKSLTKQRELDLPPEMPADAAKLIGILREAA